MLRSKATQLILGWLVLALTACATSATTSQAVPVTTAPVKAAPVDAPKPGNLKPMKVASVEVQIGVGSPIPVDAFISAELPDICAQLAEVKQELKDSRFEITLAVTPGTREECFRDTLPFRMVVPLNMVSLPEGTYTVKVNDVSTTFQWPSAPTVTPEPVASPATQTYRNTLVGFEFDYPASWLLDNVGDLDMLWSERLTGPGRRQISRLSRSFPNRK